MNKAEFTASMVTLVTRLIPTIGDEYRASDDREDTEPGMQLTVGADANGWSYQTGDNSYTGGAYGYATWAVVSIYRDADAEDIASYIVDELESVSDSEESPIFDDESTNQSKGHTS